MTHRGVSVLAYACVELPSLHDEEVVAWTQDATLERDGARRVHVVPRHHAHRDARALTLAD